MEHNSLLRLSDVTRRQFLKLVGIGLPSLQAGACAARARGGPDLVPLIARLSPSIVAIASGAETVGSGFVVRPNVLITAAHVARAAGERMIVRSASSTQPARLLALREEDDIAVLTVPERLQPITLASRAPKVGEWIVVIGNPFGSGTTATVGIISAVPGTITATPHLATQIQINASVNPGNSGGPVCNLSGEAVGATTTFVATAQGLAFAVSAARINNILVELGH